MKLRDDYLGSDYTDGFYTSDSDEDDLAAMNDVGPF